MSNNCTSSHKICLPFGCSLHSLMQMASTNLLMEGFWPGLLLLPYAARITVLSPTEVFVFR